MQKKLKKIQKNFQKPIDKPRGVCYNVDTTKGEHPKERKEKTMRNLTSSELIGKIKELKTELADETSKKGNSKRASFLQATINLYAKKLSK